VDCADLAGRGYPDCLRCVDYVDRFWLADWHALLATANVLTGGADEGELAKQVLVASPGEYPWTCVDAAMVVLLCPDCCHELATGPLGCAFCRVADERRWAWDHQAPKNAITPNEHALRVARATLRATNRHRTTVVLTWRLFLPFLLVGETIDAQAVRWVRAYLRAGRYTELAAADSYAQLAAVTLPVRTPIE